MYHHLRVGDLERPTWLWFLRISYKFGQHPLMQEVRPCNRDTLVSSTTEQTSGVIGIVELARRAEDHL